MYLGKRNDWSKQDVDALIKLYPFFKNDELSEYLCRSVSAIQHKAVRLNLKKDNDAISIHKMQLREENSPMWKGGRKINKKGHVLVLDRTSPHADANGYVLEHRKVMCEHIGRPLKDNEVVHHINGIKTDNRIENLQLMDRGEHTTLHHTGMKRTEETKSKISESRKRGNK